MIVAPGFVNYKKGRTRLAAASDKAYQLLAHSRWFSSGTPASSTNKTGHHDIAEILLKVALSTKNQSINLTINVRCGVQTFRKENWWVASDELCVLVRMSRSLHVQYNLQKFPLSNSNECPVVLYLSLFFLQ